MCDIITSDWTFSSLLYFSHPDLFLLMWAFWSSDDVTHHCKIFFFFFTRTASLHFFIEFWLRQGLAVCSWCSLLITLCQKFMTEVCVLKHFFMFLERCFALLPFACGCPVWLNSTKKKKKTLGRCAFTCFLIHSSLFLTQAACIMLERCSPPAVGHLDFTRLFM